jgi:hypothetical protein
VSARILQIPRRRAVSRSQINDLARSRKTLDVAWINLQKLENEWSKSLGEVAHNLFTAGGNSSSLDAKVSVSKILNILGAASPPDTPATAA